MKTKPIQRVMSVVALMALALTTLVVPAFAAGPSATASLAAVDREVLAGTVEDFEITVTNTEPVGNVLGGAGQSIDWVVINTSLAFADLTQNAISTPGGWSGPTQIRSNQLLFEANTADDAIAPGEEAVFGVDGTVATPNRDKGGIFQVQVSANGGEDTGPASPASTGALSSVLRILNISRIAIIEPALATDHTVTDGQDNTVVAVDVNNLGSEAAPVRVSLSEVGDATFSPRGQQPGSQPVTPGEPTTFLFPVTFERAGTNPPDTQTTELRAEASATDRDATNDTPAGVEQEISVERAIDLAYATNSLTPRDVSAAKKDVSLELQKTGVPSASLTLQGQASKGGVTVPADGPIAVTQNAGRDNDLHKVTFPDVPFDQSGLTDGEYSFSVTASGTDDNGATVDITDIDITERIYLDLDAPVLTIETFEAPASHVDGEDDAATSDESFSLTGNVTDRGAGCGACTISGTLEISGISSTDVSVDVATDGTFDTTVPVGTIDAAVQSAGVTLTLTAVDATNDPTAEHIDTDVAFGEVDTRNADLEFSAPLTGGLSDIIGEPEDAARIDVLFDEGIAAGLETSAVNWSVQADPGGDNLVTDATIRTATAQKTVSLPGVGTVTEGETVWFVELALQNELDGNADATVTYEPDSRTGVGVGEATGATRIHDRVDLPLLRGVRETIDNIAPDLPVISLVQGKAIQTDDDGTEKFFTNEDTFEVLVTEIELGSFVKLVLVEEDGTEREVASSEGPVMDDQKSFTVAASGDDRLFDLKAVVDDNGRKVSVGDPVDVRLDRVAPLVDSAVFDGDETITVTTNEGLVGRDRAFDWYANATDQFGDPVTVFVNDVTMTPGNESYDLRQRDLDLDTSTYDPASPDVDLTTLVYDFQGDPDVQYADRAGNLFERAAPIDITESSGGAAAPAPAPSQSSSTVVGRTVEGVLGRR